MKRIAENGVHLDGGVHAFFHVKVYFGAAFAAVVVVVIRACYLWNYIRPLRTRYAVNRPETLRFCLVLFSRRRVCDLNIRRERQVIGRRMIAGEGDVVTRMPVLGSDTDCEFGVVEKIVDDWGDCSSSFDGERAILSWK